jgi:hypothetical protein
MINLWRDNKVGYAAYPVLLAIFASWRVPLGTYPEMPFRSYYDLRC